MSYYFYKFVFAAVFKRFRANRSLFICWLNTGIGISDIGFFSHTKCWFCRDGMDSDFLFVRRCNIYKFKHEDMGVLQYKFIFQEEVKSNVGPICSCHTKCTCVCVDRLHK